MVVYAVFEENHESKHNRSDQRGSSSTLPLTSGIFIVSQEQFT